ncbi:MAG: hypothetical protein ACE5EE_09675 [Fidelibacterota bacterium]
MNKNTPYDRFYPRINRLSVWLSRQLLQFGRFEGEMIVDFIAAKTNNTVLDYGCNIGWHAILVKQNITVM